MIIVLLESHRPMEWIVVHLCVRKHGLESRRRSIDRVKCATSSCSRIRVHLCLAGVWICSGRYTRRTAMRSLTMTSGRQTLRLHVCFECVRHWRKWKGFSKRHPIWYPSFDGRSSRWYPRHRILCAHVLRLERIVINATP